MIGTNVKFEKHRLKARLGLEFFFKFGLKAWLGLEEFGLELGLVLKI